MPKEELLTMPSVQNGRVLQAWSRLGPLELQPVADHLRASSLRVMAGDMKPVEAMLFDQAVALQAIFTNLSIEASRADYVGKLDPLLRLALRAQGQCRATLETLAAIKNPPVVFARQANINNGGQQQVNNGTPQAATPSELAPTASTAPALVSHEPPTELFEEQQHVLDPRTTSQARGTHGGTHPRVEAMGTIHRATDRGGESPQSQQPIPRSTAATPSRADAGAA